jgi:Xaa-Pro aminopeptidase
MFGKEIYKKRRDCLKTKIQSGVVLFLGNGESPMNYPANTYHFRQDSSFLYYWGLDVPDLTAVIDIDNNEELIFGTDYTVDDIIWMGPQETLAEKAEKVGVSTAFSSDKLDGKIKEFVNKQRTIHYLPPYRADTILKISELTGKDPAAVKKDMSEAFVRAVVAQREIKSDEEIEQIGLALDVSYAMNKTGMKLSMPNIREWEVAGAVEGIVLSSGSFISFPVIFSVHGEVLHGHSHANIMKEGDLLVLDSGAESPLHYASDITRTFPVSGKFTDLQKEVYCIVLEANEKAIGMMKPDVFNRDCHLLAARVIAQGLKDMGFMKGNVENAVAAGAHAMFFPHGLGHQLGLDVHDMEGLGEDYVGYDDEVKRSDQFGLAYLRMAKRLKPGHVVTVEPGIYFMPELMELWKGQNKHKEFIDYDKALKFKNFGGIRIEDNVLITDTDHQILGKRIAKTLEEVEDWCSQ